MPKKSPPQWPKRMFCADGRFYWKPERRLRPDWRSAPLGKDFAAAAAEARRLNAGVDAWLAQRAAGGPAAAAKADAPKTVGALIRLYMGSQAWRRLRPRTQGGYLYEFGRLEQEFGDELAATLRASRVREWHEALQFDSPATARAVAAKGKLLFNWAQRMEYLAVGANPFAALEIGQGRKRPNHMRPDDLRRLVAACDAAGRPSLGTALVIAFACVQRITDVLTLRQEHVQGGRLIFHQSKSARIGKRGELVPGFRVDMVLPPIVQDRLAAAPPPPTADGWLIVSEETQEPYHEQTASRVFLRIRRALVAGDPQGAAHLAAMQLRDGRRSGFVQYHLDGAGVGWICSISGHSIDQGMQIIDHYLPKTSAQADAAVAKFSVR